MAITAAYIFPRTGPLSGGSQAHVSWSTADLGHSLDHVKIDGVEATIVGYVTSGAARIIIPEGASLGAKSLYIETSGDNYTASNAYTYVSEITRLRPVLLTFTNPSLDYPRPAGASAAANPVVGVLGSAANILSFDQADPIFASQNSIKWAYGESNGNFCRIGMFCSPPLYNCRKITAGNWTFASMGSSYFYTTPMNIDKLALYVWRSSTSEIVGTIFDNTGDYNHPAGSITTDGTKRWVVCSIAGAEVADIEDGDQIVFEWYAVGGPSDTVSENAYFAGSHAPGSNDAVSGETDCDTYLEAPENIFAAAGNSYDDGTPSGGIVFGGEVVEVGSSSYTDPAASGGLVFGGTETSIPENHQVDGTTSGGIVFGGTISEQWETTPNNYVAVKNGTYRIAGTIYTLAVTMSYTGLGDIAALVDCGDAPTTSGYYRYDLLSVDSAGVITVTAGAEATTPVMPSTPSNEVKLDHVLRYYGQTKIIQGDIGKVYTTPALTQVLPVATDDELAWAESSTAVTVTFKDQYGALYTGTKTITVSFLVGNGSITPMSKSGSASSFSFTYTRGGTSGDVSPVIQFASDTGPIGIVSITLLDVSGNRMF